MKVSISPFFPHKPVMSRVEGVVTGIRRGPYGRTIILIDGQSMVTVQQTGSPQALDECKPYEIGEPWAVEGYLDVEATLRHAGVWLAQEIEEPDEDEGEPVEDVQGPGADARSGEDEES